jgi:hypothetical protein
MKYNELVAEMTAAHTTADVMAVIDKFVKSPERKSANKYATLRAFGGNAAGASLGCCAATARVTFSSARAWGQAGR